MDIFVREERRHNTRRGAVYNWMWSEKGTPSSSRLASVLTIDTTRVHLHSSASLPLPISVPTDFWTVLQSFENRSLWKYFKCDGDGSWITDGLALVHWYVSMTDRTWYTSVEMSARQHLLFIVPRQASELSAQ